MAIWDDLSDDELYFILECDKLKFIYLTFDKKMPREKWIAAARKYYQAEYNTSLISQSIFSSMNDAPSYSFMTLLSIVGTISLKVFALSFLTAGFSLVTLATAAIFFAASYNEQKNKNNQDQKFFDFAAIKIQCAEEIIRRHESLLQNTEKPISRNLNISPEIEAHVSRPFEYRNTSKLDKIKPAIAAGLLTATMAFGTYYLGVTAVVTAFGAVAAAAIMTGPIGIGIAAAVAIAIGIFCGIKQYQMYVLDNKIQKQQKHMEQYFHFKRNQCYELQKLVNQHSLDNRSAPEPSIHMKKLPPPPGRERDFLMRQNALRKKTTTKLAALDPITPSPRNSLRP